MRQELNDPPATWQQRLITLAVVIGIAAGVAAIVIGVAALQRTCAVYDLTGQEARCKWSGAH
jgi:hypothetical protein